VTCDSVSVKLLINTFSVRKQQTLNLCSAFHFNTELFLVCLYSQSAGKDTSNFDSVFTKEAMKMTPTDGLLLQNIGKNVFNGFSFTNPKLLA
jgi:hypothetical protein